MIGLAIKESTWRALCGDAKPVRSPYGLCYLWLDESHVRELKALRGPSEGFDEPILRLIEAEHGRSADDGRGDD